MSEEEIKTDHFKTMEELLKHLKMWEKDDDYEAYCRFFDERCAYEMAHYIDKLQKENEDMREELQMYVDTDVMILQKELKDSINARFELQRRIDKTQKENAELKEEIKDLIEENHKHIDYIANMKKKHEDKIRTKIKELEEMVV